MRILDRSIYVGPSHYARFPVIRLELDLGELEAWPTGRLGKGFVDAGSLWGPEESDPTVQDSKSIRVSAGVGLQWISPFGPIRIDYALPVRKESFDKTERFRFSFGTRF